MSNTYTAYIAASYSFNDRLKIGNAIVSHIQTRSKGGRGVGGRRLKNYEDGYVKTIEFKAAGKSKRDPNLTLTGKMLSDLVVLDASRIGRVTVGFRNERSNDKSEWMREKGYDFMGLSNSELQKILSDIKPTGSIA